MAYWLPVVCLYIINRYFMFSASKMATETNGKNNKDKCGRCGACLSFCPVYKVLSVERYSPRGKNFLIRSSKVKKHQGLIKETITACLQCGACSSLCGSKADVSALIRTERENDPYFRSIPRQFFGAFEKMGPNVARGVIQITSKALPLIKDMGKRIKPAKKSFLPNLAHYRRKFPGTAFTFLNKDLKRPRIFFFTGCVQNFIYPETASKIAALFGWELTISKDQFCCGLPAYSQGALSEARAFAKRNLHVMQEKRYDIIITGCASCAYMIKRWPQLFPKTSPSFPKALETSKKVMELSEFLHDFGPKSLRQQSGKRQIILQIPCHQRHGLQTEKALMDLGRRYWGIEDSSAILECCGLGGTFSILNKDISKKIFESNIISKIESISSNRPAVILTTCSGCLLRLKHGVEDIKAMDVTACHLVDLLVAEGTA